MEVIDSFLSLLTFLLIVVLSPLTLLIVLVILIWRQIVKLLADCFKDFEVMASGQDMLFMMDNITKNPHSAIPLVLLLDTEMKPLVVEQGFEKLFEKNLQDYEEKYEKLKLFPIKWLGFCFWTRENDFKVRNHITIVKDAELNSKNLPDFVDTIIRKGFKAEQSPWEILIIPNFDNDFDKTALILRIHHTLMDGKCFVKLFAKITKESGGITDASFRRTSLPSSTTLNLKTNRLEKFMFWINVITTGPYIYFKELIQMRDENCIQSSSREGTKKSGQWICTKTKPIPFKKVKMTKNTFKSAVTSVTIAAISGALRKYIIKYHSEENVPQIIHAISSIPLPNHPDDKLTNHLTAVSLEWPVREVNIIDRIEMLNKTLKDKASSMFPIFSQLLFAFVGIMPVSFIETATSFKSATILFTNIRGVDEQRTFCGTLIKDAFFWLPSTREATAISIGVLVGNDNLYVSLVSDKACFGNKEKLEDLTEFIYEEFLNIIKEAEGIELKASKHLKKHEIQSTFSFSL